MTMQQRLARVAELLDRNESDAKFVGRRFDKAAFRLERPNTEPIEAGDWWDEDTESTLPHPAHPRPN